MYKMSLKIARFQATLPGTPGVLLVFCFKLVIFILLSLFSCLFPSFSCVFRSRVRGKAAETTDIVWPANLEGEGWVGWRGCDSGGDMGRWLCGVGMWGWMDG